MAFSLFRILILILFFISSLSSSVQEKKFKLKTLSFGFGYSNLSGYPKLGLNTFGTLGAQVEDRLISLYFGHAWLVKNTELAETVKELNITYGQEYMINSFLVFEGHVGVGYFQYKKSRYKSESS